MSFDFFRVAWVIVAHCLSNIGGYSIFAPMSMQTASQWRHKVVMLYRVDQYSKDAIFVPQV
jgi:hypothetical protein